MSAASHALLIGIDRYQSSSRGGDVPDLRGAVADVADMASLLVEHCHVEPACIEMLLNEDATRQEILDAIRRLAGRAKRDDIVVFHFSGHGSYAIDRRTSARVGTLVAVDSRSDDGFDLAGGELVAALRRIQASHVALVLDCCHAGNLVLSRGLGAIRGVSPRPKGELATAPTILPRGLGIVPAGAPFVSLTAASPLEHAYECVIDQGYRGVFTHALGEIARARTGMSYRDVLEFVRHRVQTRVPAQHPQVEGPLASLLFLGREAVAPRDGLSILGLTPDGIRMAGGSAAGVTVGSRYEVYPRAGDGEPPSSPLAEVEVSIVHAVEAEARIVSGGPVPPAALAVEVHHAHQAPPVRVAVHGLTDDASCLLGHSQLAVVESGPRRAGVDAACDIVVSSDDDSVIVELPLFGVQERHPFATDAARSQGISRILHWAKWITLLRLDNARTDLVLELSMAGVVQDGGEPPHCWLDATRRVRYALENKSAVPLFVSVLAFSTDGSVALVYPPHAGSRVMMPGERIEDRLIVDLPPGALADRNVLKAVGTRDPSDLSFLEMGIPSSRVAGRQARGASGRPLFVLRNDATWTTAQAEFEARLRV